MMAGDSEGNHNDGKKKTKAPSARRRRKKKQHADDPPANASSAVAATASSNDESDDDEFQKDASMDQSSFCSAVSSDASSTMYEGGSSFATTSLGMTSMGTTSFGTTTSISLAKEYTAPSTANSLATLHASHSTVQTVATERTQRTSNNSNTTHGRNSGTDNDTITGLLSVVSGGGSTIAEKDDDETADGANGGEAASGERHNNGFESSKHSPQRRGSDYWNEKIERRKRGGRKKKKKKRQRDDGGGNKLYTAEEEVAAADDNISDGAKADPSGVSPPPPRPQQQNANLGSSAFWNSEIERKEVEMIDKKRLDLDESNRSRRERLDESNRSNRSHGKPFGGEYGGVGSNVNNQIMVGNSMADDAKGNDGGGNGRRLGDDGNVVPISVLVGDGDTVRNNRVSSISCIGCGPEVVPISVQVAEDGAVRNNRMSSISCIGCGPEATATAKETSPPATPEEEGKKKRQFLLGSMCLVVMLIFIFAMVFGLRKGGNDEPATTVESSAIGRDIGSAPKPAATMGPTDHPRIPDVSTVQVGTAPYPSAGNVPQANAPAGAPQGGLTPPVVAYPAPPGDIADPSDVSTDASDSTPALVDFIGSGKTPAMTDNTQLTPSQAPNVVPSPPTKGPVMPMEETTHRIRLILDDVPEGYVLSDPARNSIIGFVEGMIEREISEPVELVDVLLDDVVDNRRRLLRSKVSSALSLSSSLSSSSSSQLRNKRSRRLAEVSIPMLVTVRGPASTSQVHLCYIKEVIKDMSDLYAHLKSLDSNALGDNVSIKLESLQVDCPDNLPAAAEAPSPESSPAIGSSTASPHTPRPTSGVPAPTSPNVAEESEETTHRVRLILDNIPRAYVLADSVRNSILGVVADIMETQMAEPVDLVELAFDGGRRLLRSWHPLPSPPSALMSYSQNTRWLAEAYVPMLITVRGPACTAPLHVCYIKEALQDATELYTYLLSVDSEAFENVVVKLERAEVDCPANLPPASSSSIFDPAAAPPAVEPPEVVNLSPDLLPSSPGTAPSYPSSFEQPDGASSTLPSSQVALSPSRPQTAVAERTVKPTAELTPPPTPMPVFAAWKPSLTFGPTSEPTKLENIFLDNPSTSSPTERPTPISTRDPTPAPTMAPITNIPTSKPTTESPTISPSLKPTSTTSLVCTSHHNTAQQCDGTSSSLELLQKCLSSDSDANDQYGGAIAMTSLSSGDSAVYAIVGARNHERSGSAYLLSYDRGAKGWEHVAEFVPGGASVNGGFEGDEVYSSYDQFGAAVAISPDWVVVSASFDTASTGKVSLFWMKDVLNGGRLIPDAELVPPDGAYGMRFGSSVAIDRNTLVVGAMRDRSKVGSVYVFRYSGGNWVMSVKLAPDDASADSQGNFGSCVAISDGIVVVGAPYDGTNGRRRNGSVYVYADNGSGLTYSLIQKIVPLDLLEGDQFGFSIDVEESTNPSTSAREVRLAVGARFDDDKGQDSGSVYTYLKTEGDSQFLFDRKLTSSNWSPGAELGTSVALHKRDLVAGAKKQGGSGSAHRFRHDGISWMGAGVVTEGKSGDDFGSAVALEEGVAVVGSHSDDSVGANGGALYSYAVCD